MKTTAPSNDNLFSAGGPPPPPRTTQEKRLWFEIETASQCFISQWCLLSESSIAQLRPVNVSEGAWKAHRAPANHSWRDELFHRGAAIAVLPRSEWRMRGGDEEPVKKEEEDAGSYTSSRPSPSSTCSSPTGVPWDQAGWRRLRGGCTEKFRWVEKKTKTCTQIGTYRFMNIQTAFGCCNQSNESVLNALLSYSG